MERTALAARESFDKIEILQDQRASQQDEKMDQMQRQMDSLENDVRGQVDQAIRDLEGSDLKIQQEINELTDRFRELTNDMNQFKSWVSNELKQEFGKINSNFMSS